MEILQLDHADEQSIIDKKNKNFNIVLKKHFCRVIILISPMFKM